MTAPLDTLAAGLFAPALGQAFTLNGPDGTALAATLAACTEYPRATMPGSPRTAFSLLFACPAQAAGAFAGGDCVLSHPTLGAFGPLYLERVLPVGHPPGTATFQAQFS
ncbi:DUF6916 family protein [Methylobacterium sp. Gmos1]